MYEDDFDALFRLLGYPGDLVMITPRHDPATWYEGRITEVFANNRGPIAVQLSIIDSVSGTGKRVTLPWDAIESIAVIEPADTPDTEETDK